VARPFDDLFRDIRHAVRSLRRSPGFSLTAIVTLGLGLGANAAIFSVLDAALLRPLPYPESDRIVTLHILGRESEAGEPDLFPWSYPKFERFRTASSSFSEVAGYGTTNLNLSSPDGPERLEAELVSAGYFSVLGLQAVRGRLLLPGEDARSGEPAVVVLSHGLWQRRFGADSALVGSDLRLNGRSLTVIGIAPAGFRGLSGNADVFVPISLAPVFEYPSILTQAANHWFLAIGKLRPGRTLAAAELDAAAAGVIVDREHRFPEQQGSWSAMARPLDAARVDPGFRRSVLLLWGAVGLVLLIACVNLTSLLLVRTVARRREIAVRLALGARRGRLVRQVLTESLMLSLAGFGLALLLAQAGVGLLLRLGPGRAIEGPGVSFLFDPSSVHLSGRVALVCFGLSLLAALLVGLIPALQASRPGLTTDLKAGGGAGTGTHRRRPAAQQILVVAEVALALVLLAGAGLLTKSFARLHALDPGFEPKRVLTLRYSGAAGDFAVRDGPAFREAVVTRLAALPGVHSASVGWCAPLTSRCSTSVINRVDGQEFKIGSGSVAVGLHPATPDHFRALGIPVLRGRVFTAADRVGAPRVVIINETAAARQWPGQDPVGRRLAAAAGFFSGGDSSATVIGVVKDVRYGAMDSEAMPDLYFPGYQIRFGGFGTIFVRTSGEPTAVRAAVEREVRALDPALPLYNVMTMEERAGAALSRQRFSTTLLAVFALLALVLAAIGLYGTMAFSVAQRTREIGLRMALGADAPIVLRKVLGQGLALAGVGIGLGLAGAVALQRVIAGMLYEVEPTDPLTLAGVSALMAVAALLAALLPARRATRVDPMEALKAE
jgi:putative ABC transport system permease protein